MRMLPVLQGEMSTNRHCIEFTFVNGTAMEAIVFSVRQAEHERLHRKTMRVLAQKPVSTG